MPDNMNVQDEDWVPSGLLDDPEGDLPTGLYRVRMPDPHKRGAEIETLAVHRRGDARWWLQQSLIPFILDGVSSYRPATAAEKRQQGY
jgi:hypothetical protein